MNKEIHSNKAGKYKKILDGESAYHAFVPNDLPPVPMIEVDSKMQTLLSNADRALGGLNVVNDLLPDSNYFILSYLRKEATLSNKIEGTQATFVDVAKVEAEGISKETPDEFREIINYVRAINYGLNKIRKEVFPFSLRLVKEIHEKLLGGVRGESKTPGEFRRSQNWIGGATINTATYIPPIVDDMNKSLNNFEKFIHDRQPIPPLVRIGLIHSQFENIHPFLDGNGRIGRLLITLLLCHYGILNKPTLYLSEYFHIYQKEYYNRLDIVHEEGNYEAWIKFFLEGVWLVAEEAMNTARKINRTKENDMKKLSQFDSRTSGSAIILLEKLFSQPVMSVSQISDATKLSFANANNLVDKLYRIGILKPIDQRQRDRLFAYSAYLKHFKERETYKKTETNQ